jgi:hypothetical protein
MLVPDRRWFAEDSFEGERGAAMLSVARDLANDQEERNRQDLMLAHGRIFEQAPLQSLQCYSGNYGRETNYRFDINDAATWNVARSVILTAAAMVGSSQPRIRLLTNDGSFGQKRRARKASLWYQGWADEADLHSITFECLVDSMVFDLGVLQVYEHDNKVCVQRILPFEILIDAKAAIYGQPRAIYRRRYVDKDIVYWRLAKGLAKDLRELIRTAPTPTDTNDLLVWEAWHLPSAPGAKDGRHVIAVELEGAIDGGVTLTDEPYEKDYYPLIFWRYEKARSGFYGMSLMRQLEPIQTAINLLLAKIEKAQRLMCVPRVAIAKGSKIVEGQLANKIAGAIEYVGTEPKALVWPALPPEVYDQLARHEDHAYALPGISRNFSRGEKEAGTVSAVAIRESLDVQQGRQRKPQQMNERAHVEIAKVVLDMVADIAADKSSKGYVVHAPGALGMLEPMDWKKLGLDRKGYKVGLYPTNNLPLTPAGRLEYVQEMLKAGLYDQERATAAMDELDPDSENGLESSPVRLLEYQFEEMLYEGRAQLPDDFTPYATALNLGAKYLALARIEKAPAKNTDLVRRFLQTCKAQDDKLKAAAAPPPVANPPITPGVDMPPEQLPVAA